MLIALITWLTSVLWSSLPLIFLITSCLYLAIIVVPFWRRIQIVKALPGPPISHWFYGHMRDMRPVSKGLRFKRKWTAQFPKLCRYVLAPWVVQVQVCHPETIKQLILELKSEKGQGNQLFTLPTNSLFFANGDVWKERRRMLTPVFHFDMLNIYVEQFNRTARMMLDKWQEHCALSQYFDCSPYLNTLALDSFLQSAFSIKCSIWEREGFSLHEYESAQNVITSDTDIRVRNPLYRLDFIYKFSSHYKRLMKAQHYVRKVNMEFLNERREDIKENGPLNKKDFCTILLTIPKVDGSYLTDDEIQAEVNTFIFAGHETTSNSMGWAIYNFGKYPHLQESCREEVNSVLGDRDAVTREDIQELKLLSMFIKESMRMYPVVTSVNKVSTKPLVVDGYTIPTGTLLNVGIHQVHYLEEFWPEPDRFNPYRFSSENIDKINPFAYIPFSAGARNCIGQKFAIQEMQIVLALILKKFRISIDYTHSYEPAFRLVIKAENGIKIKLDQVRK